MDIQKLIDDYAKWLKDEITFEKYGEYYEITTPFLDNANDYLQIYVKQSGDSIYISDDGATLQNLEMQGLQMTPARKQQLDKILAQYRVERAGDELIANTPLKEFPQRKHMFIQAMMRIEDLLFMARPKTASSFIDEVDAFFEKNDIFCMENIQITGRTGLPHTYDFVFQRSKTKNERFCRAINNPSRSNMTNVLFAWTDTMPTRRPDSQLIVILNDQNRIASGVEDGFLNYDAKIIRWSERNNPVNRELVSA